jgi:hypothetical protein
MSEARAPGWGTAPNEVISITNPQSLRGSHRLQLLSVKLVIPYLLTTVTIVVCISFPYLKTHVVYANFVY